MRAPEDLRDMLLAAGVPSFTAPLSIQYMMFLPRTCDPYAQGVIQLVKGLQRMLNRRGHRLVVDGGLGVKTVTALRRYSGRRWYDKTWMKLYRDVMTGRASTFRPRRGETFDDYYEPVGSSFVGDLLASPLPWLIGGAAAFLYFRKRRR